MKANLKFRHLGGRIYRGRLGGGGVHQIAGHRRLRDGNPVLRKCLFKLHGSMVRFCYDVARHLEVHVALFHEHFRAFGARPAGATRGGSGD